MTFDWLTDALRPRDGSSDDGSSESESRGWARIAFALTLGPLVFPIQYVLLVGWRAATDVPVVAALAALFGLERSGLPGYFLLVGVGSLFFATISLGVVYALAIAVFRSRRLALLGAASAVGLMLLSGALTLLAGPSGAEGLAERAGELERAAEERVAGRADRTGLDGLRVESGPTYASVGATADNPRPEWGDLRWSLRLFANLRVPEAGAYELTVEYRLPGADEWHARIEKGLALEDGSNRLEVTLDANDSRGYQGFWAPERAGGTLLVVLRRTLEPEEFYGTDPAGMLERARRIFGDAAEALRPTPRTVELLRDRIAL